MADNKQLLILRLEGALQSWGTESKWDFRDTGTMPSKSGVIGLLACAMGIERESPEIAQMCNDISIAVREDRPGQVCVDFQTVTGHDLMTASGKKRSLGNTFISRRCYLQDASFLVVMDAGEIWTERIIAALKNPKWFLYLGRKCCVPSRPVLEAVTKDYASVMEAIAQYPVEIRKYEKDESRTLRYETDCAQASAMTYSRQDNTDSRSYRGFTIRKVWTGTVSGVPCKCI